MTTNTIKPATMDKGSRIRGGDGMTVAIHDGAYVAEHFHLDQYANMRILWRSDPHDTRESAEQTMTEYRRKYGD